MPTEEETFSFKPNKITGQFKRPLPFKMPSRENKSAQAMSSTKFGKDRQLRSFKDIVSQGRQQARQSSSTPKPSSSKSSSQEKVPDAASIRELKVMTSRVSPMPTLFPETTQAPPPPPPPLPRWSMPLRETAALPKPLAATTKSRTVSRETTPYIKKEPVTDLSLGDNEDDDTIQVMAHSYKKRLDLKNQANAEANARIEKLETEMMRQGETIRELRGEERLNARIVEHTLTGYLHDQKRLDVLTQDSETFQCILHSLKSLLERAQHGRHESVVDYEGLSQTVCKDKVKLRQLFRMCQSVMQRLYDLHTVQLEDLHGRQQKVQVALSELKSWWTLEYHPRLDQAKSTLGMCTDVVQEVNGEINKVSQHFSRCVAKLKENKMDVDTVVCLSSATRLSLFSVYQQFQQIDTDVQELEEQFNLLSEQNQSLMNKNALLIKERKKESEITEEQHGNSSRESAGEDVIIIKEHEEFYHEDQEEKMKQMQLKGSLLKLENKRLQYENEKLTWDIERRTLLEQKSVLLQQVEHGRDILPTKSFSDSLVQYTTPVGVRPAKKLLSLSRTHKKPMETSIRETDQQWEIPKDTSSSGSKYFTRRKARSLVNQDATIHMTEEISEEEKEQPKKRRKIRKLNAHTNDLEDSDDADIPKKWVLKRKKITKVMDAVIPENAKNVHISTKKK
ncbi:uncharacterized protein EV154DRAFT_547339 [Mucor mucedo]|uniref:uncharacterized protein n=1 Tax=Mucor mucedo TaxID=29922 RepID=UPI00221FDFAE|nr:uncharacterized protein EV154DRAFT_547339 [Mucor mucedo]KAI7896699.1 hypothetical protein EV154DRAFT_547339 [Mucor mucedo]